MSTTAKKAYTASYFARLLITSSRSRASSMRRGSVKPAVYRLTIDLTTRRVSEPEKYVFRVADIIDSMKPNLPALWPGGPRQSAECVMFHELKVPDQR